MTAARELHSSSLIDRVTAELIHAIADHVPRLPNAACRDHVELYDRAVTGPGMRAARRDALEICSGCPALARCRRYVESLSPYERPYGVIGGMVVGRADHVLAPRTRRPGS